MKHIFMRTVNIKKYYLGYKDELWIKLYFKNRDMDFRNIEKFIRETKYANRKIGLYDLSPIKIDEDRHDTIGVVVSDVSLKNYEIIDSSEDVLRELEIGDSAYFYDKSYCIQGKSYGLEGEIIYFTNDIRLEIDEESILKANEDLEKRKSFVKLLKEKVLDNPALLHDLIDNRNWFLRTFFPINKQ